MQLSQSQRDTLQAILDCKDHAPLKRIAAFRGVNHSVIEKTARIMVRQGLLKKVRIHKRYELTPEGLKALSDSQ